MQRDPVICSGTCRKTVAEDDTQLASPKSQANPLTTAPPFLFLSFPKKTVTQSTPPTHSMHEWSPLCMDPSTRLGKTGNGIEAHSFQVDSPSLHGKRWNPEGLWSETDSMSSKGANHALHGIMRALWRQRKEEIIQAFP